MSTQQGLEHNQMSLNVCVQLDGLCLMTVLIGPIIPAQVPRHHETQGEGALTFLG